MEWIRAAQRTSLATRLVLSVQLLLSTQSYAADLECPAALSSGQPACNISRDVGSQVPDESLSKHVGNPIDVVSGNKYQSEVDVNLGDSHLSLARHYNSSLSGQNIGLGNGWRHTYSVILSTDGDDVRQIMQSDGRLIVFRKQADLFLASQVHDGQVIQTGDNKHVWELPDGRRLSFYGSFLTSINFADTGTLSLFYNESRLHSVTDEQGRSLQFRYAPGRVGLPGYEPSADSSAAGHLVKVILPDDSEVNYLYSKSQNLVAAVYPRGAQGNRGRRYQYQDPSNSALLTQRGDDEGRVFARWRYDRLGRAVSFRSGGSIGSDGSEVGPPDVALEYTAGMDNGKGITRVVFDEGSSHVYEWLRDDGGQVLELRRQVSDLTGNVDSKAGRRPASQESTGAYDPYFPDDVLTVTSVDALGYPSSVQLVLERDGSTHSLRTQYDQAGHLVDVSWLSGMLEDFNTGQITTRAELSKFANEQWIVRTQLDVMFSALSQKAFIEGTASEFLTESEQKRLSVGVLLTGEALNEARSKTALSGDEGSAERSNKVEGGTEEGLQCADPLKDCESLLRTQDYAEVAECAYTSALCHTRFVEADLDSIGIELGDLNSGSFRAEVFLDRDNDEYIVAFAETDFTSGGDWMNNLEQELGFSSFQYRKAVQLARRLIGNNPAANFSFVGHSLGGGLATAAAAAVGGNATVFNPAALDRDSAIGLSIEYENAQSNTQIYSVADEILSVVQTGISFTNTPPGTVHALPRPAYSWIQENLDQNIYTLYGTRLGVLLHGMGAVRQSLTEQLVRNQCV